MNATESIWRHCAAQPNHPALAYEERTLTYDELRRAVLLVSLHMAAAGIRRGEVVALGAQRGSAFTVLMLATARMGAIGTPYKPWWSEALKHELLARNEVRFVVRDEGDASLDAQRDGVTYVNTQQLFGVGGPSISGSKAPPLAGNVADELWWIALSSGTTGTPKSIPQTHSRVTLSSELPYRFGPDHNRILVFNDLAITPGLNGQFRALIHGNTLVLPAGASSAHFLDAVVRHRPTRVQTSTGLAAAIVRHPAAGPEMLAACSSVMSMSVSGAALPPQLRRRLHESVCGNIEVGYGSTEASGFATLDEALAAERPDVHGRLHPWVAAEAVSEDGRPLPPGEIGQLRFHTPMMARHGYLGDEEATRRTFRDGWYYPGDVGAVDATGLVRLVGRADHVLNLGGRKVNPELIEEAINSHPAVTESAVVGVPHPQTGVPVLTAVVVAVPGTELEEIRAWCASRLQGGHVPRFFVAMDALPKNSGGKIHREKVRRQISLVDAKEHAQ
jgi:acyl-coenzyme A synthetase/AMP-(fatty) acid ligase